MPETYRTILEEIARNKSSILSVFSDFCRMSACALAAGTREEEYFEVIKPYSKEELNRFSKALGLLILEMENYPFEDVLGTYYPEISSKASQQDRGEFYTPSPVCELMARMTFDPHKVIQEGKPVTINEPCCGSGGMVLALAKLFSPVVLESEESYVDLLRFTCQDINPIGVDMCFINTSLWGIPAVMVWGDTLRMTVNKVWSNVHWLRVGEDQRQAFRQVMRLLVEPAPKEPPDEFADEPASPAVAATEQFTFDLEI